MKTINKRNSTMKTIIVTHSHRFGITTLCFKSKNFSEDNIEEHIPLIVKSLEIDFDPETETLDFNVLPDKDIVVINF